MNEQAIIPATIIHTNFRGRYGSSRTSPLAGLLPGDHLVRFQSKKMHIDCIVKVFTGDYGWSWKVLEVIAKSERTEEIQ